MNYEMAMRARNAKKTTGLAPSEDMNYLRVTERIVSDKAEVAWKHKFVKQYGTTNKTVRTLYKRVVNKFGDVSAVEVDTNGKEIKR